jgi:hypothetical protein
LRNSPQWARVSPFTMFLDHTQRHATVGRTPLDEWSARRIGFYLTTHNTHNRHTSMFPPWDSNPQSQQASVRRPTSQTARPLGPTKSHYRTFLPGRETLEYRYKITVHGYQLLFLFVTTCWLMRIYMHITQINQSYDGTKVTFIRKSTMSLIKGFLINCKILSTLLCKPAIWCGYRQ